MESFKKQREFLHKISNSITISEGHLHIALESLKDDASSTHLEKVSEHLKKISNDIKEYKNYMKEIEEVP